MKAPFPYFGGKSTVAAEVWRRLGDVDNYIEPFFGSGAVLLQRPHEARIETVNDLDANIANFWRTVQAEPDRLADLMNWPVNETDQEARHKWLVRQPQKSEFAAAMKNDPHLYDVQRAAWWCWGLCAWIGTGWCGGEWYGDEQPSNKGRQVCNGGSKRPHLSDAGLGVHKQLPHLGAGRGVHKKRPDLGDGRGVHKQLPHLGNAGTGVHKQLPHLGDAGRGECERRRGVLRQWMQGLCDRLRNVRVCCGDWIRVCNSTTTTTGHGLCGVFLDPPYGAKDRRDCYAHEDYSVAERVRAWCVERGDDPQMRIALCGYTGEGHEQLESLGWSVMAWKAAGGYGNQGKGDMRRGENNANRERIWFSPHCVPANDAPLFAGLEGDER
jgi:hypothetical protein